MAGVDTIRVHVLMGDVGRTYTEHSSAMRLNDTLVVTMMSCLHYKSR